MIPPPSSSSKSQDNNPSNLGHGATNCQLSFPYSWNMDAFILSLLFCPFCSILSLAWGSLCPLTTFCLLCVAKGHHGNFGLTLLKPEFHALPVRQLNACRVPTDVPVSSSFTLTAMPQCRSYEHLPSSASPPPPPPSLLPDMTLDDVREYERQMHEKTNIKVCHEQQEHSTTNPSSLDNIKVHNEFHSFVFDSHLHSSAAQ